LITHLRLKNVSKHGARKRENKAYIYFKSYTLLKKIIKKIIIKKLYVTQSRQIYIIVGPLQFVITVIIVQFQFQSHISIQIRYVIWLFNYSLFMPY